MNNVATETEAMLKEHPSAPPKEWYENLSLPISWLLVAGKMDGKRVLDIGCATGWVGYWAEKEGAKVTACDIFSTYVHPKLLFVECSKENMPFTDGFFDVILTANVLHHGSLDLTEILRVLKKGGLFVSLQEPCIDNNRDEAECLNSDCAKELQAGIDEHRPSLRKYIDAFTSFASVEFYAMGDQMFVPPKLQALHKIEGDNYYGGIAIRAIK